VIRRKVTIQGDAVMLPLIDCEAAVRAFRVEVRLAEGEGGREGREEALGMMIVAGALGRFVVLRYAREGGMDEGDKSTVIPILPLTTTIMHPKVRRRSGSASWPPLIFHHHRRLPSHSFFIPHLPHPTQAGGSLTMRFVRLNKGKGIIRPRSAAEVFGGSNNEQGDSGNGTTKGSYGNMVLERRGCSVLFEPGAEGGSFVGVYFVGEEQGAATMQESINQSWGRVSVRVYGDRVSAVTRKSIGR